MSKQAKTDEAAASPAQRDDVIGKRIAQMREARKGRKPIDDNGLSNMKLSVPEDLKDPRATYRWVNDKATRVHQMKQKGWQIVDDAVIASDDRNSGVGSNVERIVDERTTKTGAQKGFLMWKPKEFYEEDKAAEQKAIKEREAGLRRGETRDPSGLSETESYIPSGGIKIG